MTKSFDLIRELSFFDSLAEDDLQNYLKNKNFKVRTYGKNTIIHFEGESCHHLEIILSGKIVVDRIDKSGNLLTISEFFKDDIIGGNLLFSKNPLYPMTVSTQNPSEILEISREVLFELLLSNPGFLHDYLELMSDHAAILGNTIKHYVQTTIRESLMSYLQYESRKQNTKTIKLPMTKKALAEKIGVQRTSLSRELSKMKDDGLIHFNRNIISLLS